MAVMTPWGYSVDCLPPIVDYETFTTLTGGAMSSTRDTVEAVLDAVSASVRDWCGWHVSPSLECDFIGNGEGNMLMLPAMGVTAIDELSVIDCDGNFEIVPTNMFEWTAAGMVRLRFGRFPRRWRSVQCVYTAGFNSASLAQITAQIASNALAASPGVSAESAGGVSISYNRTGDGITGGVSLLPRDLGQLEPYRLARAW